MIKRGFMIPVALAVMAILITLVLALDQHSRASRVTRQLATAQIQAEQGVANGLAGMGMSLQSDPVPGSPAESDTGTFDFDSGLNPRGRADSQSVYLEAEGLRQEADPFTAEKLFTGLPEVGGYDGAQLKGKLHKQERKAAPWTARVSMKPDSWRRELAVFGERRYEAVMHEGFPLAAYAPSGSVTLESVNAWTNPTIKEKEKNPGLATQDRVSGLAPWVAAKDAVKVTSFPYGEAYVARGGSLSVGEGAIGYPGLPLPAGNSKSYENLVLADLQAAYFSLDGIAVDKTDLIWGRLGITAIISLFKGEGFPNLFTLENALNFMMPTVPFIKSQGAWIELRLHVPLPPDQNLENVVNELGGITEHEGTVDKLGKLQTERDGLKTKLKKKQKERDKHPQGSDKYKELDKEVKDFKEGELKDKEDEISATSEKLEKASNDARDFFEEKVNGGVVEALDALPESREDEKNTKGLTKASWKGFSYVTLVISRWKNLLSLVGKLASAILGGSFNIDTLLEFFTEEVRLVHLGEGKPEPSPDEMFQKTHSGTVRDTFEIHKTWNVPPGRTFKISTSMKIVGDLWLQKGSCMVVAKDLTLEKNSEAAVFAGNGRIYLEEGATLCVGGDLTTQGDFKFGSVVVAAPVSKEHPITSAILCKGSVKLPFGTRTGITMEDLAGVVDDESGSTQLRDVMEVMMMDITPNMAKVLGPFHMRYCYFAKWCTTISFPTIFPVPIPTPIPDNKHKNYMTLVFRGLTAAYTAHLNLTLGENLMTSTDWWVFGKERVPVVPKLDPFALKSNIQQLATNFKKFVSDGEKVEDTLEKLGKDMITKMITDMLKPLLTEFISEVISSAISALLNPVAGLIYDLAAAEEVNKELEKMVESVYDPLVKELTDSLGLTKDGKVGAGVEGSVSSLLDKVESELNRISADVLLPETPGVLVYGDAALNIGGRVACGWFISKGNVNITASHTVGAILSTNGDVTAKNLLYNPYFTRAFIYLPAKLNTTNKDMKVAAKVTAAVKNKDYWENGVNFLYGKSLDKNRGRKELKALSIGRSSARLTAAGWRTK